MLKGSGSRDVLRGDEREGWWGEGEARQVRRG